MTMTHESRPSRRPWRAPSSWPGRAGAAWRPNPLVGAVVLRDGEVDRRGVARRVRRPARGGGGARRRQVTGLAGRRWSSPSSPARTRASSRPASSSSAVPASRAWWRRSPTRIRWRRAARSTCGSTASTVEIGLMQREAAAQNAVLPPCAGLARRRPYVALKLATSLDAPHRRSRGALALDQRPRGARLGAVAAGRVRRARGRQQHRAAGRPVAHGARDGRAPAHAPAGWCSAAAASFRPRRRWRRTARETPTTVFVAPGTGAAQRALASAGVDVRETTSLAAALATLRDEARRERAGGGRRSARRRAAGGGPGRSRSTGCRARSGWARACRR